MSQTKRGNYCWGCDKYKSNESFSGKGHKNHLCKKCNAAGITSRPKIEPFFSNKNSKTNKFMKTLKIIEILYVENDTYVFFHRSGECYVWLPNFSSLCFYVNRKDKVLLAEPYKLANDKNIDEILEALNTKMESRISNGQYIVAEEWSEIQGIAQMGLSTFKDKILELLEIEDDLIDDDNFYPSEFVWALNELDSRTQELILLLPQIRKLQNSYQDIDEDELDSMYF
jgi:hypothetical protein